MDENGEAPLKKRRTSENENQLDQMASMTILVADTGDIGSIREYSPTDATTNPSLLYKAAQMPEYADLVSDAVKFGKEQETKTEDETMGIIIDRLSVNFGKEITQIVPGYVSTEVDARLSFDTEGTIERARRIIGFYEEVGVPKSRILIKVASTWEGIQAARVLEAEGITCNMTLLFSLAQAIACANVGATLISPFVGRILDWHKKDTGRNDFGPEDDPGVLSVRNIYNYYKKFGHNTIVMGASFRNKGEITALAGCDRLTIAPKLLNELRSSKDPVKCVLSPELAQSSDLEEIQMDEAAFRWLMNEDAMATEKLAEGIRKFSQDLIALEDIIRGKM